MTSRMLARKIAGFALSKKAMDVVLLDLRKLEAPADFFVICNADSTTQARAIAEEIRLRTKKLGVSPWHSEGLHALSWVLIDFVDVVVHVFLREARSFYNLERLWGEAPRTVAEDTEDGIVLRRDAARKRPSATRSSDKKKTPRHSNV